MPAGENVAGVNVDTTLIADVVCYSDRLLSTAGPSLGSELAGMLRRSFSGVMDFEAGCRP